MNPILNATGWGELPEKEIDIPFFMTAEYRRTERRIAEAEQARVAAAVGKERRKLRKAEQQRRDFRVGTAVTVGIFALLVLAVNLVELLA